MRLIHIVHIAIFADNSDALMQLKGKENEMKSNDIFTAPAPQIRCSHKAVGVKNKKRKMRVAKAKLTYTAKLQKSESRASRYR